MGLEFVMKAGLVVSAIVGSFLGYLTGGGFLFKLFGYYIFLPLGVLCLVYYLFFKRHDRKREKPGNRRVAKSLVIAVFLLVTLLSGEGIFRFRSCEVESFVRETIPLLDAHKDKFGEYPSKLQEVTDRKLPYYFRDRRPFDQPYSSNGEGFTFSYVPPDAMMRGLMLTSSDRRWSRAD